MAISQEHENAGRWRVADGIRGIYYDGKFDVLRRDVKMRAKAGI
jgi:hypothetical protein